MYRIQNTTTEDLEFVYYLFDEAILYQKRKGFPVWNGYDKEVLKSDVAHQLQYKILHGDDILCVFSICFSDSVIWRAREQGDAIYLHRIVVNPLFKGQKQFERIFEWAKEYAKTNLLNYVRMDTWGDNQNIIDYYTSFGFSFIENYLTPDTEELASQHRNLYLALLEYKV